MKKPLLTYRCGHKRGDDRCLLALVGVVDGTTKFVTWPDETVHDVPPERSPGVVAALLPLRCEHLTRDLHPAVVRHDLATGRRVVVVWPELSSP